MHDAVNTEEQQQPTQHEQLARLRCGGDRFQISIDCDEPTLRRFPIYCVSYQGGGKVWLFYSAVSTRPPEVLSAIV